MEQGLASKIWEWSGQGIPDGGNRPPQSEGLVLSILPLRMLLLRFSPPSVISFLNVFQHCFLHLCLCTTPHQCLVPWLLVKQSHSSGYSHTPRETSPHCPDSYLPYEFLAWNSRDMVSFSSIQQLQPDERLEIPKIALYDSEVNIPTPPLMS